MKKEYELRVEEAMQSLDGMARAAAPDVDIANMLQRYRERHNNNVFSMRWQQAAAAVLLVLLGLNLFNYYKAHSSSNEKGIQEFSTAYELSIHTNTELW